MFNHGLFIIESFLACWTKVSLCVRVFTLHVNREVTMCRHRFQTNLKYPENKKHETNIDPILISSSTDFEKWFVCIKSESHSYRLLHAVF